MFLRLNTDICSEDPYCRGSCDPAESLEEREGEREDVWVLPRPPPRHFDVGQLRCVQRVQDSCSCPSDLAIPLRGKPKAHTVPPNTDRFCNADTSQEIETATDVGCKHSEFLMFRATATSQLLVQTLLYQWHSDVRTLILTVPIQCAKTGQQIHP